MTALQPGDIIEGFWPEDEEWLDATLKSVHADGSLTITWTSDGSESDVPAGYARRPSALIENAESRVHLYVDADDFGEQELELVDAAGEEDQDPAASNDGSESQWVDDADKDRRSVKLCKVTKSSAKSTIAKLLQWDDESRKAEHEQIRSAVQSQDKRRAQEPEDSRLFTCGDMAARGKKRQHDEQAANRLILANVPYGIEMKEGTSMIGDYMAEFLSTVVKQPCTSRFSALSSGGQDCAQLSCQGRTVASLRLAPQGKAGKYICRGFGFLELIDVDANAVLEAFSSWKPLAYCHRKVSQTALLELRVATAAEESAQNNIAALGHRLKGLIQQHGGSIHHKDWPMEERKYLDERGKRRNALPREVVANTPGLSWNSQSQSFQLAA